MTASDGSSDVVRHDLTFTVEAGPGRAWCRRCQRAITVEDLVSGACPGRVSPELIAFLTRLNDEAEP